MGHVALKPWVSYLQEKTEKEGKLCCTYGKGKVLPTQRTWSAQPLYCVHAGMKSSDWHHQKSSCLEASAPLGMCSFPVRSQNSTEVIVQSGWFLIRQERCSKTFYFQLLIFPVKQFLGATHPDFQRTLVERVCICVSVHAISAWVGGILFCICWRQLYFLSLYSWLARNRPQIPLSKTQQEHMFRSTVTTKWEFYVISVHQKQLKTICLVQEMKN